MPTPMSIAFEAIDGDAADAATATITDRVFDRLSEAIISGALPPGSKLSEPKVARELGVSRAPLREAIRRLEGRKLVVSSPNHGARVTAPTRKALFELYSLRFALEGLAAREAAANITDEEIEQLRQMLVDHETSLKRTDAAVYWQETANNDFHFFIARAGRNEMLFDLLCREYYPLLRFYRMQHQVVPGRAMNAYLEHVQIVDALADRDSELAELLMRRHIEKSRANLESGLKAEVPGAKKKASRRKAA